MENISKALLIAGGILIALIILSMLLVMYNNVASISSAKEAKKEQEQLQAFNAQYEAYNKQIMYGVDVITLCNKIRENNRNINNYKVQIMLMFEDTEIDKIILLERINESTQKFEKYAKIYFKDEQLFTKDDFIDFDKSLFKCTNIDYNEEGIVSKIYIEMTKQWVNNSYEYSDIT